VKRIDFLPSLSIVGILIASLSVLIELSVPGQADDAPPAPAPKAGAEASGEDAKKAEAEAVLVDMFKKESNITNSLGMVLVWLPEGYRAARFEVTQQQYEAQTTNNPSRFSGPTRPVENVTWIEASQFCRQLTENELKAGKLPKGYAYSLPTEKQWEYFVGDARLEDAITSFLGDRNRTESVGGLGPNNFGLYDVRGNVWEWCDDTVARGASWMSHGDYIFVPFRYVGQPDQRYDDVGFRIILQGSPASSK
jgi:formylglycine-generating enzyme required for sulfatase activity